MEQRNYKKKEQNYQLKMLMVILLSIIIGSCYSIESDCGDGDDNFFWESTSRLPINHSVSIASNGDIWVGTIDPAIYLSTDNGNTWVQKGVVHSQTQLIAINPISGYLFAGTTQNGLFRSTNRGESWIQVLTDDSIYPYPTSIAGIFITPSGEIYCRTYRTIFYSNDNGDTWVEKDNDLPSYVGNGFPSSIGPDGTLYTGTHYGVYRSTDGGDTWLPPTNYINVVVNDITVSDDGSIFAATGGYGVPCVLKSTDKGDTWTQVNDGFGAHSAGTIIYNPITKDLFVTLGIFYNDFSGASYTQIYRSTNLGKSWKFTGKLTNSGLPNEPHIYGFAFNPITGQMYVATTGGVYRSKM